MVNHKYNQMPKEQGLFLGGSGSGALVVQFLFILGLNPQNFLKRSCFSNCIDLAFNVLYCSTMMNFLIGTWLLRSS